MSWPPSWRPSDERAGHSGAGTANSGRDTGGEWRSGQNLPEHHGQPWADDPGEMHNWIDAPENDSGRNPHVPTCPDHVPTKVGTLKAAETLSVPTVPTCSDRKQQAARQFELCADGLLRDR